MAPSARWPDKYSALTGGLDIAGVDIVLEKGAVLTDEEKAQTACGWRSYSMIKNGVPFTATRATLFYETTVSYGFVTTAEYVNAIVAPYLNKFGIAVTYTNAAAPPPVYTLRIYSTPTTFRIGGDTFQVNKMLIKFKHFGLDFVTVLDPKRQCGGLRPSASVRCDQRLQPNHGYLTRQFSALRCSSS